MLSEVWVPLLSALIGAIFGSGGSVATVYIQTRAARQTELSKLAVQSAIEEYKIHAEVAKDLNDKGQDIFVEPLLLGFYEMDQHIKLISSGKASPEEMEKLRETVCKYRSLISSYKKENKRSYSEISDT